MAVSTIKLRINYDPTTSEAIKSLEILKNSKNEVGSEEYLKEMVEEEGKMIAGFEEKILDAVKVNYYDLPYIITALRVLAIALEEGIDKDEDEQFAKGMKGKLKFLEKITDIITVDDIRRAQE